MTKTEQIKKALKHFEANLLDGESIKDNHGTMLNAVDTWNVVKDILSEAFKEIELEGRKKELQSLIDVFKDREPLEQYTTNVILFELKGRLSRLEDYESEE